MGGSSDDLGAGDSATLTQGPKSVSDLVFVSDLDLASIWGVSQGAKVRGALSPFGASQINKQAQYKSDGYVSLHEDRSFS